MCANAWRLNSNESPDSMFSIPAGIKVHHVQPAQKQETGAKVVFYSGTSGTKKLL